MSLAERHRDDVMATAVTAPHQNALPVMTGAELEVFEPVIGTVTIDVMHGFSRRQGTSESLGHHQTVLGDYATCGRVGVPACGYVDVAAGADPRLSGAVYPVPSESAPGVARVLTAPDDGFRGDRRWLSASALTDAAPLLDFQGNGGSVPSGVVVPVVSGQESRGVAGVGALPDPCLPRGRNDASASALTDAAPLLDFVGDRRSWPRHTCHVITCNTGRGGP